MNIFFYWHGRVHTAQLLYANISIALLVINQHEIIMSLPQNIVKSNNKHTALSVIKKHRFWSLIQLIYTALTVLSSVVFLITSVVWRYLAASGQLLWLLTLIITILSSLSYVFCLFKQRNKLIFDNLNSLDLIYANSKHEIDLITKLEIHRNGVWVKHFTSSKLIKINTWQLTINDISQDESAVNIADARLLCKTVQPKFAMFAYDSKYWDSTIYLLMALFLVAIAFLLTGYSHYLVWLYIPLGLIVVRLFYIAKKVNFFRI